MQPNIAFILRETTPAALDIQPGLFVETLGNSSGIAFNVERGGGVLSLSAGTTVNLEGASDDFTFVRNGTTLEIRDGAGNVAAQIAASLTETSRVRFADGASELGVDGESRELTFAGQRFEAGESVEADSIAITLDDSDTSGDAFSDNPSGGGDTGTGGDPGGDDGTGDTGGGTAGTVDATLSGQIRVDGAAVDALPRAAATLTLGDDARGRATLGDGQQLTFTSNGFDNVTLGATETGDGTLTLRDAGTRLTTEGTDNTVQVGRAGTGELNVESGAVVSTLQFEVGRQGTGTATIDGDGSRVIASNDEGRFDGDADFEAGFVRIGRDPGSSGTVTVANGGALDVRPGARVNTDTSGPGLSLGEEIGSTGTLTVEDSGSRVDLQQDSPLVNFGPFLEIGEGLGEGHVTLQDNGRLALDGPDPVVSVSEAQIGNDGAQDTTNLSALRQSTLTLETGGRLDLIDPRFDGTATMTVAPREGADAEVEVRGAETQIVFDANGLATLRLGGDGVGNTGGDAEMTVADGARITGLTRLDTGLGATSEIEITVSGPDTTMSLADGLRTDARVTIGGAGESELTVRDGARIDNEAQGRTFVGRLDGGEGTLTVTGTDSAFDAGARLFVGTDVDAATGAIRPAQGGDGDITVSDGATLTAGTANDGIADIVLGEGASLTVESGATLDADVTVQGGSFDVAAGATFTGTKVETLPPALVGTGADNGETLIA